MRMVGKRVPQWWAERAKHASPPQRPLASRRVQAKLPPLHYSCQAPRPSLGSTLLLLLTQSPCTYSHSHLLLAKCASARAASTSKSHQGHQLAPVEAGSSFHLLSPPGGRQPGPALARPPGCRYHERRYPHTAHWPCAARISALHSTCHPAAAPSIQSAAVPSPHTHTITPCMPLP